MWGWIAVTLLLIVIGIAATAEILLHRAEPILKGRVIETLSTRFDSRVEMDGFQVSVTKGLEVSGEGLRIYPPDDVVEAGAKEPLISLAHFSFHVNVAGLLHKANACRNCECARNDDQHSSTRDEAARPQRAIGI